MKAAQSVVYHEADHKDASVADRAKCHHLCTEATKCQYVSQLAEGKSAEDFVFGRKVGGKLISHGLLAPHVFGDYPEAYDDLVTYFMTDANFLNAKAIKRMRLYVTSNANEPLHAKTWQGNIKDKGHSYEMTVFNIRRVTNKHNFGYYRASILHSLGLMGPVATRMLRYKDRESVRNSCRTRNSLRSQTARIGMLSVAQDGIEEGYRAGQGDFMPA